MSLSIFSLIGCSYIDKNQAADVEELLKEKYNQEFVVTDIGGRYGTAKNDTVTTYVHPKNNENLVFKAVMYKDGSLYSDGYIPRLIGDQLNQILKQELEKAGIKSETFTFVMNADSSPETNPKITLEEYVQKYKPGYFSAHMIVKEKSGLTPEQFEQALTAVYKAGLNTTFQVSIRVISKKDYDLCLEKFIQLSEVSKTWFIEFDVINEIKLNIDSTDLRFQAGSTAQH